MHLRVFVFVWYKLFISLPPHLLVSPEYFTFLNWVFPGRVKNPIVFFKALIPFSFPRSFLAKGASSWAAQGGGVNNCLLMFCCVFVMLLLYY